MPEKNTAAYAEMPDISDQVPHIKPYLRLYEKVILVTHQPLQAPATLPDPVQALCQLCKVDRPQDIGNAGPAVASGALAGREKAEGQGKFTVLFGRDALYMAYAVRELYPNLVRATLVTLAKHIGMMDYVRREEQFGRIVHEVRDPATDEIAKRLMREQGWEFPYYGTVDAPPLFIRLFSWYVMNGPEGRSFLLTGYYGRDGEMHTMADAFRFVMSWIIARIHANPEGFLEFRAAFPGSHMIQSMEDSHVSHINEDGELPNWTQGISSAEDQGHVYEALLCAAEIGRKSELSAIPKELIPYLEYRAELLRQCIFSKLWIEDVRGGYFASGTERDDAGRINPLRVRKAIPAFLLNTRIWTPAENVILETYIRTLFGRDMLAAAGPRTLAVGEPRFNPGRYHLGTVWPFQVFEIAEGLRRRGYSHLAHELYRRIAASIETLKMYPEFVRGESDGSLKLNEHRIVIWSAQDQAVETIEQPPQEIQGWTVTAYIAAKKRLTEALPLVKPFEADVLSGLSS